MGRWSNKIGWQSTLDFLLHQVRTRSDKTLRDTLPLSHEGQRGLPHILNRVSSLCLKDYLCIISPSYHSAKISKFQCFYFELTH